jgi:hypothetical protein
MATSIRADAFGGQGRDLLHRAGCTPLDQCMNAESCDRPGEPVQEHMFAWTPAFHEWGQFAHGLRPKWPAARLVPLSSEGQKSLVWWRPCLPLWRKSHNEQGDPVASCQSRCSLSWQSKPNLSNPAKSLPSWVSKPHFFASGLRAGASCCCSTRRPETLPGKRRAEQGQSPGAILPARAMGWSPRRRSGRRESDLVHALSMAHLCCVRYSAFSLRQTG